MMKKTMKMMIGLAAMLCATSAMAANWDDYAYHVVYDDNGGSGGSGWSGWTSLDMPLPSQVSCPTRTGYTFTGYKVDAATVYYSNGKLNPAYTSVRGLCAYYEPCYLKAIWQANMYTVTLDKQGGTGGSASVTATYGAAMPTATMPTKSGYTFLGYFDAQTGGTKYYNVDGTSAANWDKTEAAILYAQWAVLHAHDDITFTPWTSMTSLPSEAGDYVLENDVTLSGTWTVPAGTVNLCLGGHVIRESASSTAIKIPAGAVLNFRDCDTTVHAGAISNYLWTPSTGGTIEITGGYLIGGSGSVDSGEYSESSCGGGVFVCTGSTFNMYGGNIVGCKASNIGGGVFLHGEDNAAAVFNMYGGAIVGCWSSGNGGGGVAVSQGKHAGNGTVFNMYGGAIRYCNSTKNNGAGVRNRSTFVMSGGVIEHCLIKSGWDWGGGGGGVYTEDGSFTLSGGDIRYNEALGNDRSGETAGGIRVANGAFTMTGGKVYGNIAHGTSNKPGYGGGILISDGVIATLSGGEVFENTSGGVGGGVVVEGAVTLSGPIVIRDNTSGAEGSKKADNLYFANGVEVALGTSIDGLNAGVTLASVTGRFTTNGTEDDASHFTSDNPEYGVLYNADGYLEIAEATAPAATFVLNSAKQRWPWNGKVDLVYTVKGLHPDASYRLVIAVKANEKEASTLVEIPSENGTKSLVVDLDAMLPAETQDVAAQLNVKLMSVE